jgi:hypothetical protein
MPDDTVVNINEVVDDLGLLLDSNDESIDDSIYYAHLRMVILLESIQTVDTAPYVSVSVLHSLWGTVLSYMEKEKEVEKNSYLLDFRRFMNVPNKVWIN